MQKIILLFTSLIAFILPATAVSANSTATTSVAVSFYIPESEKGISIIDNNHIKNLEQNQIQIFDNTTKEFTNIPAESGNIVKYHFNTKHQYETTVIAGPTN